MLPSSSKDEVDVPKDEDDAQRSGHLLLSLLSSEKLVEQRDCASRLSPKRNGSNSSRICESVNDALLLVATGGMAGADGGLSDIGSKEFLLFEAVATLVVVPREKPC